MGFFDRFRKKKEPEMPSASGEAGEEIRPARSPTPEGEDPFSERVIAKLEAEGLTLNWRYGYKLANRYEVKRVCAGGQAVVFIVEDVIEMGKRYAAKSLKAYFRKPQTEAEWDGWKQSANDYLNECNIWVSLGKHRHIVQAEYLEKIEGVPLVMSEFIDGGGLDDWLKKGPLDVATALEYTIQACIGMEYANKKGVVVHRDIKPGNILVTREGVAKINDFGIARAIASVGAIRPEADRGATLDMGSLVVSRGIGTPCYMAPEQFDKSLLNLQRYPVVPLGLEADIYAFGVVLYEMITGKRVIELESGREIEIQREAFKVASRLKINPGYAYCFLKAIRATPPSPSRNERLNTIIFRCLRKEPSKRFHSFSELRGELMRIYSEETGREFRAVDEPAYEPNWRNKGKTCWILGQEKESLECYDKALEQNPAYTTVWLERGLVSAEAGDLAGFGLCLEIIPYFKPSMETEVQQYKEGVLNESHIRPRDIKFLGRLTSEHAIPEEVWNWVSNNIEQESADPFRELNPVIAKLLEKLEDENSSNRFDAVMALGKLADRSTVPAFIKALNDKYWLIREKAAETLGELGDRSAVPALIEALKDEEYCVRREAREALVKLADKSAVPAVIKALKEDYCVERGAGEAFGRPGERLALSTLMKALKEDRSQKAWDAFGKLVDRLALPALIEAIKKIDYSRGQEAEEALGELGDRTAMPTLIETLKDKDISVRYQAVLALKKLGDRSAVPALIETLKDKNPMVRERAAEVLVKWGDRSAEQALIKAFKSKKWYVRSAVAEALGKLGGETAVPLLIQALKDENVYVQTDAAEALGKLGSRAAVPALIEALKKDALKHEDYFVKTQAAKALGKLGDRSAVPALIEALKDKDSSMRRWTAEALGKLGDRSAAPALIETLKLEEREHAIHILTALRWLCSQPDCLELSETKDKLKEHSAFEWNKRGSELTAQSEYDKALECFEKAVEIDPDWEVPKKARDDCLKNVDEGRVQPAIGQLEEAVPSTIETQKAKLEGGECVEWLRKGTALFNLGKYTEALECYDRAAEIDSESSDAWYCKGITLNRLSKYEEAIESFDRAVKINPKDKLSWYNMGYALTKLGKHEWAKQCFDRVLDLDPRDADAWYSRGHNLAMLGRYLEAMQCYDKALKVNPRYAYAWAGKGVILHQLGKRKEAIKCFRKALEIDPSLRENLGDLLTEE